jgi:exodeoxyribonuclease VII small subunit
MASEQNPPPPPPEELSFEQAIEELEGIIDRIERGQIGLEESLAARKRGEGLIRRCRSILETAEQELKQVTPETEGGQVG